MFTSVSLCQSGGYLGVMLVCVSMCVTLLKPLLVKRFASLHKTTRSTEME